MNVALNCPRCGQHHLVKARQAEFGLRCTACQEFLEVDRCRSPGLAKVAKDVRPWTPWQIIASAFTFWPGACGAVVGFNFVRLGKRQYLIPSLIVGWILFVLVAVLALVVVPGEVGRLVALLANLTIGIGFMLVQKPYFDHWRTVNWSPKPEDPYRPNGIGLLFLICLVSLGFEIGIIVLLSVLGGTW